ncbi:integrase [Novosphingobium sp. KA1]|uniref:integrase n=1 Tax=Novosphingobium sp. (strain KA1) TaxID=164608 RepID=UPI001A8FE24E|nr:integrase [Novosphingobium sp. KA1]QSR17361.1 integrase [Novosphingobium sp. KA1]
MSRENSPYILGDYWLDKRRDGAAPEIWQIASYRSGTRSVVYISTKCRTIDLERAKEVIRSYEASQRSKHQGQDITEAELLPHLFNYLREHGPDVRRVDTIKSSFRAWIGFLMQDELTTSVRVAEINKVSVARFRRWRMAPHTWEVEWDGKVFKHSSTGVTGEAVQRNIEDLRAALKHAEDAGRIPMHPRIPSVDRILRSPARKQIFTIKQLGAIVAYADQEPGVQQWLQLMIATAARPDAALAFVPANQWFDSVINLHPVGAPITDKRNPIVPAITPFTYVMKSWTLDVVSSRKRWWRTMRAKLQIPASYVPKTIRHTVASHLRNSSVPGEQISLLLGHKDLSDTLERTTDWYAHGDPLKMPETIQALTTLWHAIEKEAAAWRADHLLTITGDNNKVLEVINSQKP